jgi:ABC-2 type transport system permease protein
MNRIKCIIIKEFHQIRRDKSMLVIIFLVPVIQLVLLGYVISSEVKNVSTYIVDLDRSPVSREIVNRIKHSGYFKIKEITYSYNRIQYMLDSGRAKAVLIIPSKMSRNIKTGIQTQILILMDGQDANTATIALGYLNGILQDFLFEKVEENFRMQIINETSFQPHFIEPEVRIWYNPDLRYSDYMVPGIAAFLLTVITSLLSAMGLVREREVGTLEQLMVTPIKRHELLIGKIVPFAIIGFLELSLAIVFAKIWYNIPIVGNLGIFIIFTIVYIFTTLGIGLFVSASTHTQQQALFMTWFIMVFAFLMSGFVFSIENIPKIAQWLTFFNPLRYFMIVIREIFIKGATIKYLYTQGIVLVLFGGIIFSFAVLRFQQRVR